MRRLPRALLTLLAVLTLCACGDKAQDGSNGENAAVAWDALSFDKTMPLDYATQFSVSYADDDYKRITIGQDQEFLLVAEGAAVPGGVPEGVTILQQPLDEIYLVASAAMDSFAQLDAVDSIRFSGRKESDWYIEQAKEAMSAGDMLYAGKYSEPDYELILSNSSSDEPRRYISKWKSGVLPSYSLTMVNVGLVTRPRQPRPRARPRVKAVFPMPSEPVKASTSPPRSFWASSSPIASVSCVLCDRNCMVSPP